MASIPVSFETTVKVAKVQIESGTFGDFQKGLQGAIDDAIAAASSKGGGGKELASATAASVEEMKDLNDLLKGFLGNSKILNVLAGTIAKAMGLLVDVILMPFMPIFTLALLGLFKVIMDFYKWWKAFWESPAGKAMMAGIKTIADWVGKGLNFLFDLTIGPLLKGAGVIGDFAYWLWRVATGQTDGIVDIGLFLAKLGISELLTDFYTWLDNVIHGKDTTINFIIKWIEDAAYNLLKWLFNLVTNPIGTIINFFLNFDSNLDEIKRALDSLTGKQTGFGGGGAGGRSGDVGQYPEWESNPSGDFRPDMKFARGGVVPRTGLALVHKGETVLPKGGGITVNITGQFKSDEEMYRRFVDRLRQEQWRTNV